MSQRDKKNILILIFCCVASIAGALIVQGKYVYASRIDWLVQHSVFPEYFRQLFYKTGEWYPDFAMSIGGGQNIFNFAYYGLLNPYILLSYLFPMIPMEIWLIGVQIVLYISSVLLFYWWIRQKELENSICLSCTLMFLLATPLLYHFYVQIMFVNYMPFLCLALIGTDRYFREQKSTLLCVSVALMILTSFYFSISGLVCLCLYAIFLYVQQTERITIGALCLEGVRYTVRLLTGVMISGCYLIPTATALLGGRGNGAGKIQDLLSLCIPLGNPIRLLYNNYGLGLSVLALVAILGGIFQKNKSLRLLSVGLFLITAIPIVTYALNGFLYNREKVLIPFLPLICFQVGLWLETLEQKCKPAIGVLLSEIIILLYLLLTMEQNRYVFFCLLDMLLVIFSFVIYYRKKKSIWVLMCPALLVLIIAGGSEQKKLNSALSVSDLDYQEREEVTALMEKAKLSDNYRMEYYGDPKKNSTNINRIFTIDQKMTSLYSSTYNTDYHCFRSESFHVEKPSRNILVEGISSNPIFRHLMGVRYVVASEKPVGYELLQKGTDLNLYENTKVRPIAYGVSEKHLISEKEYQTLSFPWNQYLFLSDTVVKDDTGNLEEEKNSKKDQMIKLTDETVFDGKLQGIKTIHWKATEEDRILFVRFRVENHARNLDVSVKIGDSFNKLSAANHIYYNENEEFTYAVGIPAGQSETTIEFSDGNYDISDVEMYLAPFQIQNQQYTFSSEQQSNRTSEILSGSIDMKEDGYLVTSFPYDASYRVSINGKRVRGCKVNKGFLGVKLKKGNYDVSIVYHAPGKKSGCVVSIFGLLLCVGLFLSRRRKS